MENVIEIRNLSKEYDDFFLNNVSFALPEGFIMGLIGPNGAGKTTIIKLIMTLIIRKSGTIKIFGMDNLEHEVAIKSRIGFVYDNPNYYDHLNLKQIKNIIAPFYPTWDETEFKRLVEKFNLPLKKVLKKFSRGMVMKAAIAIALSHHADLILMDEPTSGMDPVFRRELLDLLFQLLQDEKKSILFSTHITSDLERIADYITLIINGKIIFSQNKDEILANYALIKGDNELLNTDTRKLFTGIRSGAYGFEAVTDNIREAKQLLGDQVVYDQASLDDIMYHANLRENHV